MKKILLQFENTIIETTFSVRKSNIFYIKANFMDCETTCDSEKDIKKALNEAFACFCIGSNKFGKGIKKELEFTGIVPINLN